MILVTRVTLLGYMGSGKSTVGKHLAAKLGFPFIDLDECIEENEGRRIVEIFKEKGELQFRKLEKEYLEKVLEKEKFVLSLGGGTPVFYDNMQRINQNSRSVYLKLNPRELAKRLGPEKKSRPLISHLADDDLEEFIAKHLFERANFYNQAELVINGNQAIERLVEELLAMLKT